jgi:hypothetical protein
MINPNKDHIEIGTENQQGPESELQRVVILPQINQTTVLELK